MVVPLRVIDSIVDVLSAVASTVVTMSPFVSWYTAFCPEARRGTRGIVIRVSALEALTKIVKPAAVTNQRGDRRFGTTTNQEYKIGDVPSAVESTAVTTSPSQSVHGIMLAGPGWNQAFHDPGERNRNVGPNRENGHGNRQAADRQYG